jgi:excisionase family DNA binding protein
MASLGTNINRSPDRGSGVGFTQPAERPHRPSASAYALSGQGEPSCVPEPYVDAKDGAAFLRIHAKTLMRLARKGEVPAYSFSEGTRRHWRFLISELDTWMKSKVNSNAHPVRSVSPGRRK